MISIKTFLREMNASNFICLLSSGNLIIRFIISK